MSSEGTERAAMAVVNDGAPPKQSLLNYVDIVVVVVYFGLVMATGIYSMCRPNRGTVSGFFLAGRNMSWLPVGASLFASNIGSEHFIGLAGSGAAAGIGVGAFEFNAIILIQLLGWIFLPVFLASRVGTLPEFMKKRFGGSRIRVYLAILSLILYIFTKISVNLYSGAVFIQQALRWSIWWSVLLILLVTVLTTVLGGLAAVIYTDTLQFFIMIIGALVVMGKAFSMVGGYWELQERYIQAIPSVTVPNTTCGLPATDSWVMLRDPINSDMPWPGFILGQTPASIWYWCADQMMVQRALSAKSLSHAQGATLMAGYIKILPVFIMVLPGMISRVLFPDEVGCVVPEECKRICGNAVSCSNIAYPKLVLSIMPQGMRGVMISVMLAALMSDLTSIFNSASTLFTMDVYGLFRSKTSERHKIMVGRLFVCFMVLISIAWIPLIDKAQGGQLFLYIQSISAYLAPPIAAVYTMAVLWRRMNEAGAFWGLMSGFIVGVIRMVLDFVYMFDAPKCWETEDTRPAVVAKMHYMYFAMLLFWLTGVVAAAVSLLTEPPEHWRVIRTTFFTRFSEERRQDEAAPAEPADTDKFALETDELDRPEPAVWQRAYNWICGYESAAAEKAHAAELQRHLLEVSSIRQPRRQRVLLNSLLVVVLATGVALLAFFTVNPFPEAVYREVQTNKLRSMGYPSPWPEEL
ncbi:sodium/glucose cotransporter 5-like [Pollicipes pollicipes]|uniref:sodium/glucose cotransporter 5-like n=1 Tax=Pollicipes pollicipes TaxID=41117 RepID=UPI001884FDF6|nr:sodium/glucose cotransporter 5-like [Pollicipes pollicipes]